MKWLLIGILLLSGCTKDGFLQPKRDIEMSIDTRLPKDQNGYSVWTLTPPPPPIYIPGQWVIASYQKNVATAKPHYKEGYWVIEDGRNYYAISIQINGFISPDSTYKIEMQQIQQNVNTNRVKSNYKWLVRLSYYQQSSNTAIFALYDMKGDTITISAQMGNVIKVEKIILK